MRKPLSEKTARLINVFDRARVGSGMVTWEQITDATGVERDDSRWIVQAAVKEMLKKNTVFESQRGIGYQRLPDSAIEEHVKRTAFKSGYRQTTKAVEKLNTVQSGKLSDHDVAAWAGVSAVAHKMRELVDPKRLIRIQDLAAKDHYRRLSTKHMVSELQQELFSDAA